MPNTRSRPRPLTLVLALLAAGAALVTGVLAWRIAALQPPAFHGTAYHDLEPAPPFALVDHRGRRVTLESYRGKPVLLFFGYTHCPDVCPLTLSRLARATESLGRQGEDVRILLVTQDPARDTPTVLGRYVSRFTPRADGLTGDSASLARAYRGYGAYTMHGGAHGMSHSAAVYGIDREGRLRVVISQGADGEVLRDDLRTLAEL